MKRPVLLLCTLWLGIFCNFSSYSIIAPFFPKLAREKGLTEIEYSLIFGSSSLAQCLFSFVAGNCLLATNLRFALSAGLFLTGGANILFGCMERSPGGTIFFVVCCSIRFVEGAGFSAYLTSVFATIIRTFPSRPGYYIGLTEIIVTVAMTSGPPIGSFLYVVGGYPVPFIVIGCITLATSAVLFCEVKEDEASPYEKTKEKPLSFQEYWQLLKLAGVSAAIVCVVFHTATEAFISVSLSNHLEQFKLSPMAVGGIFLFTFFPYGLSSPIAGRLADKIGKEFLLQSCGCLVIALGFTILGPATFIPIRPSIVLTIGGLLLKGVGAGPLISCSFSVALRSAKNSGFPDNFRTYTLISTLVSFSLPLGNLIGSLTGGVLLGKLHMSGATTVYFGTFLILATFCLILHIHEIRSFQCEESKIVRNGPAVAMQIIKSTPEDIIASNSNSQE